jgi:CheY-like chemotaxis protein
MLVRLPSMPRLLVVEHDAEIRKLLAAFLASEGYAVSLATSPTEAYALLDEQTFHLLLTDLFSTNPQNHFAFVDQLRTVADPTPIGVLTGWSVPEEAISQHGLAFLVPKPFEIEDLLATIAACLKMPLSPAELRQAHRVVHIIELACAAEWDGVAGFCTENVVFSQPGNSPLSRTVSGKAAFCAYLQEGFARFPDLRLEEVLVYRRPHGMAARYAIGWHNPEGSTGHLAGALLVEFAGERICRVGARVNDERLTAMLVRLEQASAP